MANAYPQPVFLDTTVLSNFASTTAMDFLTELLESPRVAAAVRDEIERGVDVGHEYLQSAADAVGDELPVVEVTEGGEFEEIRDRLDGGEAASVVAALEHDGTVATDDLAAREVAESRDLPVTGSLGLLVLGVERGVIGRDTADDWLDTWRETRGYYAPVDSMSELLE